MSRRALVTGASGFIGPRLARRLLDDGWDVALLARSTSRVAEDLRARCTVLPSDVPAAEFGAQLRGLAPDACFHLATHFTGVHTAADIGPLVASNLELGTRLADALAGSPGAAFVNVGTVWQHHDARAYGPSSLYAATKQAFVDVLQFFAECTPLRVVTVELSDTYGPDDPRPKLLPLLVRAAHTGEPLRLSPGQQLVDYTHVDDVVTALLQAVPFAGAGAPSYSVHGTPLPLREFVALVGEVLATEVPVEWGAREYRPREMMTPWTHHPDLPGWVPAIALRDGLTAVLRRAPIG
ncbi:MULTISPECIES: NAD-dependent epimerase/dehydratase family protein [unclassified Modestobacter]|uniref:NAD-dependent epimerase/dehydratase family protein n=1 Tax=unclassified Modestobacter TaxID=2643866 RepID=UPI0022AA6A41|nr:MULTISPECIES: NAD(P)-dependent oxidoreductase [unclassified Modestobacter]MCZ2827144.1 NAD(P)-dependent oxidoreductase [Modestobacter sp. VKM Ac-2981]MCZ2854395.1 NAD(P)-dependent oxidoreductase [Modestobacter sp. VKM Ac-2982]